MSPASRKSSHHRYEARVEDAASGKHQAQLAWTLLVAVAVGMAAFYQALSPQRMILTREAADALRATSTLSEGELVPSASRNPASAN